MYIPKHFNLSERTRQLEFIEKNGFGDLVTCLDNQLQINQAPFLLDESKQYLLCHLAKMNSHWQTIEQVDDLTVCFKGPDCYISPSWNSNPNNVPTWNYVSVQVSGKATLMNDAELVELLEKLSGKHEAQFDNPWTVDKMDEKKFTAMRRAIVGIKISIDAIEAKAKLSQNKSESDFNELINGLAKQTDSDSQKVLELMLSTRK